MKLNQIILVGIIQGDPKLKTDASGKEQVTIKVICINGKRTGGRRIETKAFDYPQVVTYNPEIIEKVKEYKQGDLVIVKGAISTGHIVRRPKCTHCGERNNEPGLYTYISPADISLIESGAALDEAGNLDAHLAVKKIMEYKEVSNVLTVVGVVCKGPEQYGTNVLGQARMCVYQLALKRKLRIIGDMDDATADFPWVKSYGSIANADSKYLIRQPGVEYEGKPFVLVDGWFRARPFDRKSTCAHCGEEYTWKIWSADIVPYATEYLLNCNENPDSIKVPPVSLRKWIDSEDGNGEFMQDNLTDEEKAEAEKTLDDIAARYPVDKHKQDEDNADGKKDLTLRELKAQSEQSNK